MVVQTSGLDFITGGGGAGKWTRGQRGTCARKQNESTGACSTLKNTTLNLRKNIVLTHADKALSSHTLISITGRATLELRVLSADRL